MNYNYEFEYDVHYCYPNSDVLKNKLNITDNEKLCKVERDLTSTRILAILDSEISDNFDINYLKQLHKFIFEKIYKWAGEFRTVNISKGNQFCLCQFIESQLEDLFEKLKGENYLYDLSKKDVIKKLSFYLGEINAIHPFREGNGRVQRVFIQLLAKNIGYELDFSQISRDEMLEASTLSFIGDYSLMEILIDKSLR